MRRIRAEVADLEWRMERARAETVPCTWCSAAVGQHCTNPATGDESNAPAHPPRIADALRKESNI